MGDNMVLVVGGGGLEGVARLAMQSTYFIKATTKTTQSCFTLPPRTQAHAHM